MKVEGLYVEIGGKSVLENVNLTVKRGQVVSVLGPNGAGKTTLLRAIAGLVPYRGKVTVGGKIAYLPQEKGFNPYVPFTVDDVAHMGVRDREVVDDFLRRFGVPDVRRRFRDLSGGQKQKVLIARFLGVGADLFLLDEPLTGLDTVAQKEFESILKDLKGMGKGVVMVSHDIGHALSVSDAVLCLNRTVFYHGKPKYDPVIFSRTYGIEVVPLQHRHPK